MPATSTALCVHFLDESPALPRRSIDWKAVEKDYREAGLSLRDLACKHGCSHSAIANRADRLGWMRTVAAKPATKADGRPRPGLQEHSCP
jgi:hypothetical protein